MTTQPTQPVDALFDKGIERYKAGESVETLIPVFKEICTRSSKSSAAWTCLAWLYLLDDKPNSAVKAAQKAVKINAQDPQARINLAIALLDTGKAGVRPHIDVASQIMMAVSELREEVQHNLEDGQTRKPDWDSLKRVQAWLFG